MGRLIFCHEFSRKKSHKILLSDLCGSPCSLCQKRFLHRVRRGVTENHRVFYLCFILSVSKKNHIRVLIYSRKSLDQNQLITGPLTLECVSQCKVERVTESVLAPLLEPLERVLALDANLSMTVSEGEEDALF